jgi:5-guanidino-2-oxopentanoate decarboxylase
LPLLVWNNGALGQIRDDMLAAGIPAIGVVGRNPDFVALAKACGARALRTAGPAALTESLRQALNAAGPTLIEIDAGSFH